MTRFWISTAFLLVLITVWGCGNSDNILPTANLTGPESDTYILGAPKSKSKDYSEKIVGINGGQLNATGGTKLIIPPGALLEDTLISMEVRSDEDSRVDFRFGPHGTVFIVPAELHLSWATLKDVDADDLILYYYRSDLGQWVEETRAVFDKNGKKATLYINHFSQYYFSRR